MSAQIAAKLSAMRQEFLSKGSLIVVVKVIPRAHRKTKWRVFLMTAHSN